MGDDNSINMISSFMDHPDSKDLFGKLDYLLKDGVHIQNRDTQAVFFRFIQDNEESLKDYYLKFFGVILDSSGQESEKYFFLDFFPQSRGSISNDHRYFMPNEYVIVGFLIYKLIFIDGNLELNSVNQLKRMLRQEYEELKPGIYRVLAKVRKEKINQMDEEKVNKIIDNALSEFNKISWITLQEDHFDTLPAFHRIHKVYSDYINNVEELFKLEVKP